MSLRGNGGHRDHVLVFQLGFAVIFTPRQDRKRFPAGCVEIFASGEAALAAADPGKKRHAARVVGPSKSSEGQYIYYLMEWLQDTASGDVS